MADSIVVAGISGSLRQDSFNTRLLRASQKLSPAGMEIRILDISQLPLYNQDLEADFPAVASDFKRQIRECEGVLFVTPEYNFGMPGVLKNAIDWASRPYGDAAWQGKPVIVQSASIAWTGGLRAQYQLFQVLGYLEMRHLRFPEVFLGQAQQKFDAEGNLTDEMAADNVRKQLARFAEFVRGR